MTDDNPLNLYSPTAEQRSSLPPYLQSDAADKTWQRQNLDGGVLGRQDGEPMTQSVSVSGQKEGALILLVLLPLLILGIVAFITIFALVAQYGATGFL